MHILISVFHTLKHTFEDLWGQQSLFSLVYIPLVPQVLLGWKHGDCIDEKAKIHPHLRTYKSLTEKVHNVKFKFVRKINVEDKLYLM